MASNQDIIRKYATRYKDTNEVRKRCFSSDRLCGIKEKQNIQQVKRILVVVCKDWEADGA